MNDFTILLIILLILIGAIFIFPIIILFKIGSLRGEMRYIISRINSLEDGMRSMDKRNNALAMSKAQPAVSEEFAEEGQDKEVVQTKEIFNATEIPEIPEASVPAIDSEPSQAALNRPSPDIFVKPEQDDSTIIPPTITEDRDERKVFEKLLGTNWLSKIGIVTLVLGIGFFVKYAIDQNWINEVGRVGIGLIIGCVIIGIAYKLKANYPVFSSILSGGGIAVFYITITIAFREYGLFGQTLAFVLLIFTTVFSVTLSLLYNRKELAVFSLLGGFASPLMISTGIGNYVVLFSYIFILNTGMLIVSYIKKWRIIGIISFVLTLSFFWVWTFNSFKNEFFSISLFISLFYIQFYLLALFDHFQSERKISAYQVFLILINNLSAYFAYLYVFNHYLSDVRGLITISLALVNAVVMLTLFRNSRIDRNMIYLIIAIVLSFVSLAIPVQLKGSVITLFWAAESVVLLWLWQKSRIGIFHTGFILISLLVLISYFMDIGNMYSFKNTITFFSNRLFITGIVVIAAFVINMLLLKREPAEKNRISGIFAIIVMVLAYIVPFIELDILLAHYTGFEYYETSSFRIVALATFTTIYVAVLGIFYHKNVSTKKYIFGLLYSAVVLYACFYTMQAADLRYDVLYLGKEIHPASYFSVHLLSLPAIAYIVYLVVANIKSLPDKLSSRLSWLLTILVVVILSVETDHLVIWMSGNSDYYPVLADVHTFGYPILWGIIAMILMIWGLNRKEALLRKISLVFFAFIILKFYAYDVWRMSQSGRIISFVLLGVILLLVSFLQQKIRTLVKNDEEIKKENAK